MFSHRKLITALGITLLCGGTATARPLAMTEQSTFPASIFQQVMPEQNEDTANAPSSDALPDNLQRQVVSYNGGEQAGTVIVDTARTYLYLVLGNGRAMRYGIGVGREGFTWSGVQQVARKAEWPDWHPPVEMIGRQPYLPRFMAGGPGNPLGARAMYLGSSVYRIHGTNDPSTIGKRVSSGCIRLTNTDVADLYSRVNVGTKVIVLPANGSGLTTAAAAPRQQQASRRSITVRATAASVEAPRPSADVPVRQASAPQEAPSSASLIFSSSASRLY